MCLLALIADSLCMALIMNLLGINARDGMHYTFLVCGCKRPSDAHKLMLNIALE